MSYFPHRAESTLSTLGTERSCKMKTSGKGTITRRAFLSSSALLLGGTLLTPQNAWGHQLNDLPLYELEGSSEARARWEEAVAKAQAEGLPVYYNLNDANTCVPEALGTVRTVSASKESYLDTLWTTVIISANYGTTTANKISPFNWARIYNDMLNLTESNYNRAILDGGRTNAIYFHAVFTTPFGVGNIVGDFYAEFYHTFVGRIY